MKTINIAVRKQFDQCDFSIKIRFELKVFADPNFSPEASTFDPVLVKFTSALREIKFHTKENPVDIGVGNGREICHVKFCLNGRNISAVIAAFAAITTVIREVASQCDAAIRQLMLLEANLRILFSPEFKFEKVVENALIDPATTPEKLLKSFSLLRNIACWGNNLVSGDYIQVRCSDFHPAAHLVPEFELLESIADYLMTADFNQWSLDDAYAIEKWCADFYRAIPPYEHTVFRFRDSQRIETLLSKVEQISDHCKAKLVVLRLAIEANSVIAFSEADADRNIDAMVTDSVSQFARLGRPLERAKLRLDMNFLESEFLGYDPNALSVPSCLAPPSSPRGCPTMSFPTGEATQMLLSEPTFLLPPSFQQLPQAVASASFSSFAGPSTAGPFFAAGLSNGINRSNGLTNELNRAGGESRKRSERVSELDESEMSDASLSASAEMEAKRQRTHY